MREPGGVALNVQSEDRFRIPAYHWPAERIPGREPAALIHVPGGPGLQGVPLWEPYIPYLMSRGIDVVFMNYRGQTGYGASYERAPGDTPERAQELLAVRKHLIEELGIEENRVILYGHSYGAPIVMYAAALERLMTPLLLASATSMGGAEVEPYERCVVAFHGEADIIVEASTARASYLEVFGRGALREPCGHFETFPGEGHGYEAASSYARVFAAAVKMLEE
jgi:pimeloyl-ACP methyl ester carboxylesterase